MIISRTCKYCNSQFEKNVSKRTRLTNGDVGFVCDECKKHYSTQWRHRNNICKPMNENKTCAQYLGVYITETLISKYFTNVKHLPSNYPGYDFICENGYKIDSKSSTLRKITKSGNWVFQIEKNKIADYFVCLGFDNHENLNPLHIWIIPGKDINMKSVIAIPNTNYGLNKWLSYEKPIDKIVMCCNEGGFDES